jgi:hypothetical protein
MSKIQKSGGNMLGRVVAGSAIMVLMVGGPAFLTSARAADSGYIRVISAHGASLDGASKDPAHLNWITVSSVVAADLNGDAMADREASAPSVSEHAIVSPRDPASGLPTGKAATAASSSSGAGKSASDSWSAPTSKEAIGSQSSGAGAGKVTAPRDIATGMASGKRMHKPFTITKEIDKASPMLAQACASSEHLAEVDVQLSSGGKYTLTDVMVSSVQKSSGGDRPMETISFTYQKIEMK